MKIMPNYSLPVETEGLSDMKTQLCEKLTGIMETWSQLRLTLQSLATLKTGELRLTAKQFGELPLTANSPKFGFRYNSDS